MRWEEFKVPLGVTVPAVGVVIGAMVYLNTNYVNAEDFKQYQNRVEQRILIQQKQNLESEILKLEVKRNAYPEKFDAVDKAVLKKQEEQLKEVKGDIQLLKSKEAK